MDSEKCGNLFDALPARGDDEHFDTLLAAADLRVVRIVSEGHASPPGFWYQQAEDEWVVLLTGAATLRFEDEPGDRPLRPGDYLHIAAGRRHRVAWTDPGQKSVWLALHYGRGRPPLRRSDRE